MTRLDPFTLNSPHLILDIALAVIVMALTLFVMLRIGLVGAFALWLFDDACLSIMTLDPASWVGPTAMINLAVVLVVAAYAAVITLGGRAFLQEEF